METKLNLTPLIIAGGVAVVYYLVKNSNYINKLTWAISDGLFSVIEDKNDTPITKESLSYHRLALDGLNTNTLTLNEQEWEKGIELEPNSNYLREYGLKYGFASYLQKLKWKVA